MNPPEEKNRLLRSQAQEMESPFSSSELFADENTDEASIVFSKLASESPFLHFSPEAFEEEILDKDERIIVTDTLTIPNRWICAIDILIENPKWGRLGESQFITKARATGILIGSRYVLTAAHILRRQTINVDGKIKSVEVKGLTVSPARNRSNSNNPFGKVMSKSVRVSQPYRIRRKVRQNSKIIEIPFQHRDDYALIILEKDLGSSTHSKMKGVLGYWGQVSTSSKIRRLDPDNLKGREVVVIGYPGDTCGREKFSGSRTEKEKKISNCWNRRNNEWASTQWKSKGTLSVEENSTTIFHTADTYDGQSGAPICMTINQQLHLVGIHTDKDTPQRNKGVRVTRRMLRELRSWINSDAGYSMATIKDDILTVQPKSAQTDREYVDDFAEDENHAEDFPDATEFSDVEEEDSSFEPEDLEESYSLEEEMPIIEEEWLEEENFTDTDEEKFWDSETITDDEDEELLIKEISELLPEREISSETGPLLLLQETPPLPRGVQRFEHRFQPMKRDTATQSWVPDGVEKQLEPLDPGFFDAKGEMKPSSLNQALKDLLTKNAAFSRYLSSEALRDGKAKAADKLRVALVDLTGIKILHPEFAGWGSTVAVNGASCPKVAALYAAFQLRNDLKHIAAAEKILKTADLIRIVKERWKKERVSDPPNLDQLLYHGTNPPSLEFTADVDGAVDNIIDPKKANHAAKVLIDTVGFPYIASLMWQSGLRHPVKGGLWLTSNYAGGKPWKNPSRPPPSPVFGHNATALSLATFFTLLGQDRLARSGLPRTIKTTLSTASWFRDTLPSATIASKVGLLSTHAHEAALIENGRFRYAVAIMTGGIASKAGISLLKKLIGKLDNLIRENNP
jgi:V8-like Glu-specific endopeptidase